MDTTFQLEKLDLKNIAMQLPVAMCILNGPSFIIELANAKAIELWGKEYESVINKPAFEVFPELVEQGFKKILEHVYATGEEYVSNETPVQLLRHGQLETVYIDFVYRPIYDSVNNIMGITGIGIDSTKQIEARRKIEEGEQRLLLANEAAQFGTFDWDLSNGVFIQSDKLVNIFGFEKNEPVMHQDLINLFHPDDKPIRDKAVEESLSTGSLIYEARIIWKDSSIHWIRVFGKVIYDDTKNPQRMYGTVMDITPQKELLIALRESEHKLNIAIDATELGIFDIHLQQEEINYSPRYLEIYGFAPTDKPSRKDVIAKIHPDDLEGRGYAMEQAIKTGILDHETRVIHTDNSIRWVRVRGQLVYDNHKQPERILGTVRDITKEKNATRELQENEEKLSIAIESAQLGTWELDLIEKKASFSKKYLEILGFEPYENPPHEELVKKIHPDDLALRNHHMNHAINVSGELGYEMRLVPTKDTVRWVRANGKVFYDKTGLPLKILGTIIDITEQKNSFNALEESEERFKTIANTAPVMIWMSGNDKFADFFNTSWFNFTGRTPQQEISEGWLAGVHPDDVERCVKTYTNSFNAKQNFNIEYRLKKYDGTYRWVADNAVARYSSDGIFVGFIGACRDIDDEKSVNDKLRQRELLFDTISNVAPVGLWMTNKEGQNTFVNDTWIEWTGMPLEKQLGTGWLEKVIDEDRKKAPTEFAEAITKREKYSTEFRLNRADGELRWCLTEGSPYYDINGEFAGYAGSVTDITERKMIERELEEKVANRTAALRKSEEMNFRMINEVEDYAIILLNKEGIIENWNKGAEKIKGYTSEEIVGKTFSVFYTDEAKKNGRPQSLIEQARLEGKARDEGWRVKKDGSTFWANVVITALHDEKNNVVGFSKVTRDLTERKLAEEKLEEKSVDLERVNVSLEKSNSELEQFAYVASHDLQEPLRKIQFFIDQLQKKLPTIEKDAAVYFDKIKNSTVRMNTLIKDLLDFSRLSQSTDQFVTVDLNTVLTNITSDLELVIQQKQAVVTVAKLPIIESVPLQMQQLFYNLLSNALKFSKQDALPTINIECSKLTSKEMEHHPELDKHATYYCIAVKDNGIGFEQQYAEKIFVIFQRLNDLYTYGGTGIGLALCKKIILNHKGKIFAESEENVGSSFYVILPEKNN